MADALPWDFPRPARVARMMAHAGVHRGVPLTALLAGTRLTSSDLDDHELLIEGDQELGVARNLVGALGDPPGLGVEIVDGFPITGLGVLGFALLSSPTVGSMLALGVHCKPLSFTFADVHIDIDDRHARMVVDVRSVPDDVRIFLRDRDVSATVRIIGALCGTQVPLNLELTGGAARGAALAELPLVTSTVYDRPVDAVVLKKATLDMPLPQADADTAAACIRACEELVERRARMRGVTSRVTACIVSDPARLVSIDAVARELLVAPRTLRRHLLAEDKTFRDLLAEVREGLAIDLLTAGVSVEQTALRLGYSEAASFTRAFKHWTGYPPSQYPVARRAPSAWPKM